MFLDSRFTAERVGCERLHSHDYSVVAAVVGGAIDMRIGEEFVSLKKDAIGFIPLGVTHQTLAVSHEFSGVYVLSLSCSFRLPSGNKLTKGHIVEDQKSHKQFIEWIRCEHNLARRGEISGVDTALQVFARCGVHPILLSNDTVKAPSHWVPLRIKTLIDNGADFHSCFQHISEQIPFSKEHCNRMFKKYYGTTIQAYSLNIRADRARSLLKKGMPISDVAVEAGFYDQSQLCKVFRSVFQLTPAEYQRQTRSKS